jgi:exopolysaccharide production protein ExoZ
MQRYHSLDYLRGLAALGIMLFHYLTWTLGEFAAQSFMGRVGIYGVSIFYILSGLTLYLVYDKVIGTDNSQTGTFFKRRLLRIFPLFWLSTIASIIVMHGGHCSLQSIILNLTGLFGFVAWNKGLAVGSWSIGNELVFYCIFPILVILRYRSKLLFYAMVAFFLFLYLYFAYFLIDIHSSNAEGEQNHLYMNPLNQAFLFVGGYMMGVWLEKIQLAPWKALLLVGVGLALFTFWPESGERIRLIGGNSRLVLTISSFLICIGFYKFSILLPKFVSWPLSTLGEISYSVYMLHAVIHRVILYPIEYVRSEYFPVSESIRFLLAVALTLSISYVVYHTYEKFFIRLGKKKKQVV